MSREFACDEDLVHRLPHAQPAGRAALRSLHPLLIHEPDSGEPGLFNARTPH
jgi:hypothetical protein